MRSRSVPLYQGTTHRLILSPFTEQDIPHFAKLASDPKVQATDICFDGPITEVRAKEFIEHYQHAWQNQFAYFFGVRTKHTNELIGSVSLCFGAPFEGSGLKRGELGYWLDSNHWGQGLITEAAEALLKFSFYELNVNRVHAQHLSNNPASGRILQKLGMKYEGCLRQHVIRNTLWYDMHQYGILKQEHQKLGDLKLKALTYQ